jgi:hypothetical protein
MALTLTPQEIASFHGRYRISTIHGPVSLFRVRGRNAAGEQGHASGRYWFNEKFFWRTLDWLSEHVANRPLLNHYLRYLLRESTAVSYDWNTFASIFQLSIPPGKSVAVAVGRIAPQPFYSDKDPMHRRNLPHELLVGGEFQYIVDVDEALRPFVRGPRPLTIFTGRA